MCISGVRTEGLQEISPTEPTYYKPRLKNKRP
ncbi:hypothetical protein AYI68_g4350, partial [Smittium mucronatum]